ncbi:hypothetical protein OX283_009545 [Flavobacterium sp. SUN052]|uniref:hypothetical protein n=1 Tax=Flavobacterium sp. SUN052 TaxID=3002441 RepID=UPI00237DF524|nr:hypothetical protein [Flavobacterium sp. SUN052]MEC4004898.1 hypothetical protein [Flavobacterium sp. SUN052]
MEKILNFVQRLYNSILYNGFYIILSLLFPFVIYKLDAGHEIIANIMDQNVGLNISLIILSFLLLAFSVWCVPTIALPIWKFFTGNKTKNEVLYNYLTTVYSGDGKVEKSTCNNNQIHSHLQIPIKYFAVFPWMMFIFTCVQVFSYAIATLFAIIFMIFMFYIINKNINKTSRFYNRFLFKTKNDPTEKILLRYLVFILIFIFFIFLPYLTDIIEPNIFKNSYWGYKLMIGINYLQLFAFYIFISYLENLGKEINLKTKYAISNYSYVVVLVISFIAVITLFILNRNFNISICNPIVVVVVIVALFIMFFDICITSQLLLTNIATNIKSNCTNPDCELEKSNKENLQFYKWIVYALIPVFIYFTFFHSINKHSIREVTIPTKEEFTDQRESFDTYLKKWLDQRGKTNDPIYLVSGPGGGSRAAVWFYLAMKKQDTIHNGNFYKNIFSISTVSGSTSGANMYLAEKYLFRNNLISKKEFSSKELSSLRLAKEIYSKNYFSSTFFGLLLGDGIEGIINPKVDRNYYFQKEEMQAFSNAYKLKDKEIIEANKYFENDLLYPYKKNNFPLFLINTTLVNYGKRGIFSPVKLNDISIGVDLYGNYASSCCKKGFGLPMVTCVNQSQAFPIINSYNYLDSAGRLCDGGLYDNSGCTTTLEVYHALKKYFKNNNLTPPKIICLNILNGKIDMDFCPEYQSSSILNTLTGVEEVLFSGHEAYAYYNLQKQINYNNTILNSKDEIERMRLDKKYNLTRMLSKEAITNIYNSMSPGDSIKQAKNLDIKTKP